MSLAAAPLTISEFPAPTTPITVTITNSGTGIAQDVTLQLDGGLLTLPISQTVGVIEIGQTITTTLPLDLLGYTVGEHSLLLTTDAISLTNPVQATTILTLPEPAANPAAFGATEQTHNEGDSARGDTDVPTFHLLQVQRPPTAGYRGRVLTFALENSKGYEKELTLNLTTWLPGLNLNPATLQLSYLPTEATANLPIEPALLEFRYDNDTTHITFTPTGDGQYMLSIVGAGVGENLDGGAPEDPKGMGSYF